MVSVIRALFSSHQPVSCLSSPLPGIWLWRSAWVKTRHILFNSLSSNIIYTAQLFAYASSELRSCVKVEVAVLPPLPSPIVHRPDTTVPVDWA